MVSRSHAVCLNTSHADMTTLPPQAERLAKASVTNQSENCEARQRTVLPRSTSTDISPSLCNVITLQPNGLHLIALNIFPNKLMSAGHSPLHKFYEVCLPFGEMIYQLIVGFAKAAPPKGFCTFFFVTAFSLRQGFPNFLM